MDLIFCGGGNRRFYEIAIDNGFLYGSRLPSTIYGPLYFADQNWKAPQREEYIQSIIRYRPHIATVLDLEYEFQFDEVMDWAKEISAYVENIVIIPKINLIGKIPRTIYGKPIILGYSVPTDYGKTNLSISLFSGWNVHLLGGSPHKQYRYYKRLIQIGANVVSIDQNYFMKKATKWCSYWTGGYNSIGNKSWWESMPLGTNDGVYSAFSRSCKNIIDYWNEFEIRGV